MNITFEQFSEEIWGYGQRLINGVGIDYFCFYVEAIKLIIASTTLVLLIIDYKDQINSHLNNLVGS
ncbi:hypothetical protein [Enterococcus faecium]|uniref:hypothetical protein n=1 Tax=Enterococcus faecium TaxID=1352 RepID=UPI000BF1780D|nr:hypothetical protein [Enterococcus faecium]PEH49510.1 hypothetical protein CRM75_01730 [Enterococcus faecium]